MKQIKAILLVIAAMVLIMCICFIVMTSSIARIVPQAENLITTLTDEVTKLDEIAVQVQDITSDLAEANLVDLVNDASTLVTTSTEGIEMAMEKIEDIDLETLNTAISELQTVIEPLANMVGFFKKK